MIFHYEIEAATNMVYVTPTDEVHVEDITETIDAICLNKEHAKGMNVFVDYSKTKNIKDVDIGKLQGLSKHIKTIENKVGSSRWSLYMPGMLEYAFAYLLAFMHRNSQISIKAFKDKDKAMEWVKQGT